jgi:hypothetical protein
MASDDNTSPPEKPYRQRGYRRLAEAMAWDPGMAIFPRFRAANALNLLCLQAEVTDLEERISDIIDQNDQSPDAKHLFSCDFGRLKAED